MYSRKMERISFFPSSEGSTRSLISRNFSGWVKITRTRGLEPGLAARAAEMVLESIVGGPAVIVAMLVLTPPPVASHPTPKPDMIARATPPRIAGDFLTSKRHTFLIGITRRQDVYQRKGMRRISPDRKSVV